MADKRPPISIPQAYELAKAAVGIRSITTIRNWCRLCPELVVAEYGRLTLLDSDRLDEFMKTRPRQGAKWKPPPDPKPQKRGAGEVANDIGN